MFVGDKINVSHKLSAFLYRPMLSEGFTDFVWDDGFSVHHCGTIAMTLVFISFTQNMFPLLTVLQTNGLQQGPAMFKDWKYFCF